MSNNLTAKLIGFLFIATTVTYMAGTQMVAPLLASENFLSDIAENANLVFVSTILQLITGLGVLGIGILVYPVFKPFSERLACWYVSIRAIECVLIAISCIAIMSAYELGKSYIDSGLSDGTAYQAAIVILTKSIHFGFLIMAIILGFGGIAFYFMFYKSKLIPSFISWWGGIAATLMITGLLLILSGVENPMILALFLPMSANELFLGAWLMTKGFYPVESTET
ncbi:DUF4386 domain-containing protein [Thalassotalea ganghwensis]